MLAVVHIEENEFTASAWGADGVHVFLRQPGSDPHALARARRVLGASPAKLAWVGKPLRDTLSRIALFPWPGHWAQFKRFIVHNPLSLQSRAGALFGGETSFYPREWLPPRPSLAEHAEIVNKVFGMKVESAGDERKFYPFPAPEAVRAWAAQLGLVTGTAPVGRGLDWQRSGRFWVQDGVRTELTREESSALWEPRDLWALFQHGRIDYVTVGELTIHAPVGGDQR